MEIIILAGGLGSRLKSVVPHVPKPMADINGRPFLAVLMDSFAAQGATRLLLSVGYRQEVISGHFGPRYRDLEIEYIAEETPLGTGGALREALRHTREDVLIAANGDSLLEIDFREFLRFHRSRSAALTLAVKPMERADRYGTVIVKDRRAVGFLEKAPGRSGYVSGGVYAIDRKRISDRMAGYGETFSFEEDFLQKEVDKLDVFVYITEGYFIDIGVPEDYARAVSELALRDR